MRILVADDSRIARMEICASLLGWGHDVVQAEDGTEALRVLRTDTSITIALVDWMMPGMDGIDVCRRLRAIPDIPYVYMISITSRNGRDDLIYALEAGFDDFIAKPVDRAELNARLLVGRRIADLQRRLLDSCEQSQFRATHDALTGIWNRAAILEFLRAQLALSIRKASDLSVLVVDVDHFKKVNDTYGHSSGDFVLTHLAQTMSSVVRASDWVGRYGGEEFLVILPETSDAYRVAERIRSAVENSPLHCGSHTISATVSIGIASTQYLTDASVGKLVEIADEAMYRAKSKGRNCIDTGDVPIL